MPSTVGCYVQTGQFLMVVLSFSWIYATFFFLPLCAAVGPTGNCVEIMCRPVKEGDTKMEMVSNNIRNDIIENTNVH